MKLPWSADTESKRGEPEPGQRADEAPLSGTPGPKPDPSCGSTLPGSSVPLSDLEDAGNDALGDKGL